MTVEDDRRACDALLREGSKSFFVASRLLPERLRPDVSAVYGFCRVADDAIDLASRPKQELEILVERLNSMYAQSPFDHPVDRTLAEVVQRRALPKAGFEALLEGFAWDVEGRRYDTIGSLEAYCVRVASAVGVLMTVLMGQRDAWVLGRACDLGIAMQLTNIARDVGEDARAGRVYLPSHWLEDAGIDRATLVRAPHFSPALGSVVRRLLNVARVYYRRAEKGIVHLPWDCRYAIAAALVIYQDIERGIRQNNYDSVSQRSFTSGRRKAFLLARAARSLRQGVSLRVPRRTPATWQAAPAAQFLVGAVDGSASAAAHT